jgi:hypothetical protein
VNYAELKDPTEGLNGVEKTDFNAYLEKWVHTSDYL